VERLQKVPGVFGGVWMEAESAFPSPLSDFEAERLTSGVELPQSQTYKFEDLGFGEGDEFGALLDDMHQHITGLDIFDICACIYYAPDPRKYRI